MSNPPMGYIICEIKCGQNPRVIELKAPIRIGPAKSYQQTMNEKDLPRTESARTQLTSAEPRVPSKALLLMDYLSANNDQQSSLI